MNKTNRMHIDHYLQGVMLSKLAASDTPLRFSELKDDGIENSLFMYHANKLIARGMLEKTDKGFYLTPNGARWVNTMTSDMWYTKPTPRPLIQFVITRDNEVLLSSRTGQLKELLNDYMLPGGLHKLGFSADDNAARIVTEWWGESTISLEFLAVVETIATHRDGFTHHSLSHIFRGEADTGVLPPRDPRFEFHWVPIEAIRADSELFAKSQFVPLFMQKVQSETVAAREVIRIDTI
ncbi:MAG TPA: NUDIX domain-containing protein [Candidatus Saccharimonadales bacterium]|nr:NUDIX domain-containing protein [Candidatus Saccharimonadales bacterium]